MGELDRVGFRLAGAVAERLSPDLRLNYHPWHCGRPMVALTRCLPVREARVGQGSPSPGEGESRSAPAGGGREVPPGPVVPTLSLS